MKKLVIGMIATVFLSSSVFAQNFDEQGIKHNEGLKELLQSFDNSLTKSNVNEKTFSFIKKRMSEKEFEIMPKFSDYTNPISMLDELYSKGDVSSDLYSLVQKDIYTFQSTLNYKEVETIINTKLKEKRNLNSMDEKAYLSFLSVAKHSSKFWDINGENGSKYLPYKEIVEMKTNKGPNGNLIITYEIVKISWYKVFLCDAIADLASGLNPAVALGASAISAVMQSDL